MNSTLEKRIDAVSASLGTQYQIDTEAVRSEIVRLLGEKTDPIECTKAIWAWRDSIEIPRIVDGLLISEPALEEARLELIDAMNQIEVSRRFAHQYNRRLRILQIRAEEILESLNMESETQKDEMIMLLKIAIKNPHFFNILKGQKITLSAIKQICEAQYQSSAPQTDSELDTPQNVFIPEHSNPHRWPEVQRPYDPEDELYEFPFNGVDEDEEARF